MSVSFYPEKFFEPSLNIANTNFGILADLLRLESPDDDNTGSISAEVLLQKIESAREELRLHGKEWERSDSLPPEGQEDHFIKNVFTFGLSQDRLSGYLDSLDNIGSHAQANGQKVAWS